MKWISKSEIDEGIEVKKMEICKNSTIVLGFPNLRLMKWISKSEDESAFDLVDLANDVGIEVI